VTDSDAPVLLKEKRGAVLWLTMNRPAQRNAQDTALIDALSAALKEADWDDDVRVVCLAGSGDHWSTGHDLKGILDPESGDPWRPMRETPEGKMRHEQLMYVDKCLELYHFRKPTIAVVQGACVAAGLMLASMCDLIIAAEDAFFSNPVLKMSGAGVELLTEPWDLGFRKAKEFLFTGDKIGAQEAWRLGLVNRLVPRADLESAAMSLAEQVALVPPITAQMVKQSINQAQSLAGKEHSWKFHFLAHHFTHNSATALGMLEARQGKSMQQVFADRDRGDVPTSGGTADVPTSGGTADVPTSGGTDIPAGAVIPHGP
jgi:enoyl-CoA hydratase